MNIPTRHFSNIQEKYIAKLTGGKLQANSGGTKFGGGDIHTDCFFIEAKTPTTSKQSFTVKKEWLEKMEEQSFEQGKNYSALAFRFNPDVNKDWYIISEKQFIEFLKWKEGLNERR